MLTLLAVYCVFVVCASVVGGWLPAMIRMTHLRTQLMMSFVAGLMLGIAMLHLLPHASSLLASPAQVGAAGLGGIIAMFLLLRAFHPHQHDQIAVAVDPKHEAERPALDAGPRRDENPDPAPTGGVAPTRDAVLTHPHDHADPCDHVSHPSGGHAHHPPKGLGWVGMFFGLWLHTLMDGVALAASVAADWYHNAFLGLAGFGTFLAVALHKPLDAFAITSLMQKNHWTSTQQNLVNFAFSMACPLGACLFYIGATQVAEGTPLLGWGLAISAGFFICIALSDLLPEVSFHDHDRGKLTAALMVGVLLAVAIENLPGHQHGAGHEGHSHRLEIEVEERPPVESAP